MPFGARRQTGAGPATHPGCVVLCVGASGGLLCLHLIPPHEIPDSPISRRVFCGFSASKAGQTQSPGNRPFYWRTRSGDRHGCRRESFLSRVGVLFGPRFIVDAVRKSPRWLAWAYVKPAPNWLPHPSTGLFWAILSIAIEPCAANGLAPNSSGVNDKARALSRLLLTPPVRGRSQSRPGPLSPRRR